MSHDAEPVSDTADREIVTRRIFAAPRELVFTAWTERQHVGRWWGPRGFTTTTSVMDVRPGGEWRYVMHGPDGTDYENRIRYTLVERPARLEYEHGGGGATAAIHFLVTVTFDEVPGGTAVTMRSLFPTAAARAEVVERYGAIEGAKQHLERLGEHVSALAANLDPQRSHRRFTRTFAAPAALVFRAWTDPVHLAHWWGPHDFTNPICEFDARVGGKIHIDMRGPDGVVHTMRGEVREIEAPRKLVFLAVPVDAQGVPQFEVLNSVQFSEADGKTTVTVDTEVRNLTAAGLIPVSGMVVGWTQSLERLDDLLLSPDALPHPERDIVTTRYIPRPRAAVYAAWTDPAQLQRWWGPKDFTNTFQVFDLRIGGEWRFVMHAPNGTDFPNHSVFTELQPPELLGFDHLSPIHLFTARITFYEMGDATIVRFRMRFPDAAACAQMRDFIVPANEQNFDRLEAVLAGTL
jgi:uncharacterized protein YndB with AHSA1/START domain